MTHDEPADDPPAYGDGPAVCLTYAHGRRVAARLVKLGHVGLQRNLLGHRVGKYLHALEFGQPCDAELATELLDQLDLLECLP